MPTRDTAWSNGTPCWVDYTATEIETAKAFYADVLGWSYSGGEPEYGGYLTCEVKGAGAAGMGPPTDPDASPTWTTYFATDDVDAAALRCTEAGGSLVFAPMDVGLMGRMAIIEDPQGNSFGLWQAGIHTGFTIYNEPGAVVWNEAIVEDPDAAKVFYTDVFGYRFTEIDGMGGYSTFATDGASVGGLGPTQENMQNGWSVCFSVASVDDTVAAVEKGGGKVTVPPLDTPYGRFAVVQDPWGAAFELMQGPAE